MYRPYVLSFDHTSAKFSPSLSAAFGGRFLTLRTEQQRPSPMLSQKEAAHQRLADSSASLWDAYPCQLPYDLQHLLCLIHYEEQIVRRVYLSIWEQIYKPLYPVSFIKLKAFWNCFCVAEIHNFFCSPTSLKLGIYFYNLHLCSYENQFIHLLFNWLISLQHAWVLAHPSTFQGCNNAWGMSILSVHFSQCSLNQRKRYGNSWGIFVKMPVTPFHQLLFNALMRLRDLAEYGYWCWQIQRY